MQSLATMSVQRNIAIFVLVLAILVGGTWATVKLATEHLLYQDATSTARNWARYLAESVTDLEQIAAGERPSAASMAFFQGTLKAGQVFRYEIFNRQGYSQLVADHEKIGFVELSEYSTDAARSMRMRQPQVDAKKGETPGWPVFFSQAYVPVIVNEQPIAIVAAYVDQTEQRDVFYGTFLTTAATLCLLVGLSFSVPAIAWYRRTREKQRADRRIRYLAHHDALTGLTNRPRLIENLENALPALAAGGHLLAVHFLDIDRFKEINDTLGHDGGDFLLKTVAERLRGATRRDDVVARLGGDEFVVVQANVKDKNEAEEFAQRLLSSLSVPMQFNENAIVATVSVGVAMAPGDGSKPEHLLKSADLALYKSKSDGRNCVRFFVPEMDTELQARIELERTIRSAIRNDRFELHYQPVFEMSCHHLIGFEALVRLPSADGTLIAPMVFIPVAEEMRLIDKIGAWVLREACRTAATWPKALTVAVNLSPAQFEAGSVSDVVSAALEEAGLEPHRLELEITETLLLGNNEGIMLQLQKLKALGVAIVLDDFGTGHSSLSYLWRFPFDKIKIDQSFMGAFDGSGRDAETVIEAIIALGRKLKMRFTVEGVETAKHVAFLDQVDADQVQGFFFGRPIPATEIAAGILTDFQQTTAQPLSLLEAQAKSRLVPRPPGSVSGLMALR